MDIAAMNQGSIAHTKRLLNRDPDCIASRLERERTAFVEQFLTPGARRGMAEFLGVKA
jgi:hypothetical protein